MRSMTGFGKASGATDEANFDVQIKAVNGRFLDIHVRMPRHLLALESSLQATIRKCLKRGRVDAWVELREKGTPGVKIHSEQVQAYLSAAQQLTDLGVAGDLDVATLLGLPQVLEETQETNNQDEGQLGPAILGCVECALAELMEHRSAEGAALKNDLADRILELRECVSKIAELSEDIVSFQQSRLEKRLAALQIQPAIDPTRLAQEVAFLADRSDISEEITRLNSHLDRFQEALDSQAQAVGKNLDFLTQELHREMNTILSKSGKTETSSLALEGKVAIEKVREQVQNVE